MADQSCCSPKKSTNASHPEVDSEVEKNNPTSSSCDPRISSELGAGGDDSNSCLDQSPQSCNDTGSSEESVKTTASRNGVSDTCPNKIGSFLRPATLSGGSNVILGGQSADSQTVESTSATKCPLKSPKLNLTPRFGSLDASLSSSGGTKLPFQQFKCPFTNTVSFEHDKNESLASKNNVLQTEFNVSGASGGEKLSRPFSSFTNAKPISNSNNTNSSILTTNFVFGQNLHERVADGIATSNNTEKNSAEGANGNGTTDMLFTSVLTSKEIAKETPGTDIATSAREPFSLIEDAARCQEARANKRKYEEVLVTTGEEDEENILQVNVKLFAFDSGTWVERGRGVLRLNDKNCDGTIISRIVIRTLGSLRVVLNTKIWSGMSLSRASERSIRLTAMDPNGQLKIFLIQASPKDMCTLFRYLDIRLQRCQDNQEEPEKKRLEQAVDDGDESEENKT